MIFTYRAYLADGSEESGTIDSPARDDAVRDLSARGRSVFQLGEKRATKRNDRSEASKSPSRPRIGFSRPDPGRLFSDLALLTQAGLTVSQALRALRASEPQEAQRNSISMIADSISAGVSVGEAFSSTAGVEADTTALLTAGAGAARLPAVFQSLADEYRQRRQRRDQLRDALTYPSFLLLVALLAVGAITFFLVPAIAPIFDNFGREPPLIVSWLSAVHGFLTGPFAVAAAGAVAVPLLLLAWPRARQGVGRHVRGAVLKAPVVGDMMSKQALARYLSSLSLLLGSGVGMAHALALSADCVTDKALNAPLLRVRDQVSSGRRLAEALSETNLFDARITALIAVGDEAAQLPTVAQRASSILQDEATRHLRRFAAMLTPVLTISLGLLIGSLVVSVMTALLSINEIAIQ